MRLLNKKLLLKFKRKSRGNRSLDREIDSLIEAIETGVWKNQLQLKKIRPDADCVHTDGFYFFNILALNIRTSHVSVGSNFIPKHTIMAIHCRIRIHHLFHSWNCPHYFAMDLSKVFSNWKMEPYS